MGEIVVMRVRDVTLKDPIERGLKVVGFNCNYIVAYFRYTQRPDRKGTESFLFSPLNKDWRMLLHSKTR